MNVLNAKIVSSNRRERIKGGIYIEFISQENVVKGDKFSIVFENLTHYFEASEISIEGKNLKISAHEVGYWAKKFDNKENFDLRKLIDLNITAINDKETISKINEMSCWC